MAKNIKLLSVSGEPIDSAELSEDFRAAVKDGPFWVGAEGFYYRDGLRKYYIPIAEIDNVFTRIEEVSTHMCCCGMCMYLYRFVACSDGKELCDVRTEDEPMVERVQKLIAQRNPAVRIGFTKPE